MKKLLALFSVGMLVAMWSGCGVTDPAAPANIAVTVNAISEVTVNSGSVPVVVKIESDSAITAFTWSVTLAGVDKSANFQVGGLNSSDYMGKKSVTLNLTISAITGTASNTYTFEAEAVASSISDDDSKDFVVKGQSGTPITTDNLTIGSFDNATVGSSIDLDSAKVKMAADAVKDNSGVDICGTYSTKVGSVGFRFFNPEYAKASSNISAFSGWVNPAATRFHKVTVDFATITKVEQIEPLYVAASGVDFLICNVDDVLVVKTSENKYALIKVVSFQSDVTGTAVIKYGK